MPVRAAKAEVANVLIEVVLAYLECELDGGHIAGARKCSGNGDDMHAAIAFVVVNDASGERDLPALAVDHVVGLGDVRVERGGVGDQLEDGSGLVDVADGMVFEQRRRGVPKVVGIEGGADGERKDLAGVHVLHDDGAVVGVRLSASHDRARVSAMN